MDQNPIQNNSEFESEVLISEKIPKKTLRFIYLSIGVLLFGLSVFFLYTKYIQNVESNLTESNRRDREAEARSLDILKKPWAEQGRDSTQAALDKFVDEIDEKINAPGITINDKKKLLLSKAMALGTARSEATRHDNVLEASNILNSLYDVEVTNTSDDKFKYATLSSYMSMLHSTCYYPRLGNMLPGKYARWYKRLIEREKLPEKQALILAFDRFVHEGNDPRYWNDSSIAMNRAYLLGLYFDAYGSGVDPLTLEPVDREAILWNKLKATVAIGTSTEPILVTGINRGEIDPAFRYAFAFDIFNTYSKSKIDVKTNEEIDANYEDVFELIVKNGGQIDVTSTAVSNILNSVFYIESMHRRYPNDVKTKRINEVVDIFITSVSLNSDTKALYSGYFLEGTTKEGQWMPVRRRFLELVPEYPKLDKFFSETFGID
jgi:hypothetical protein